MEGSREVEDGKNVGYEKEINERSLEGYRQELRQ